jgi:hypothetical protein
MQNSTFKLQRKKEQIKSEFSSSDSSDDDEPRVLDDDSFDRNVDGEMNLRQVGRTNSFIDEEGCLSQNFQH